MVGGPMETQGKLSHQLRCPPGQRATQVPGSTRVAGPKEPPRRRLAQQVLRMAGQRAQDYERTPGLLRGRTAVGEGSESFEKAPVTTVKHTLFRKPTFYSDSLMALGHTDIVSEYQP